MQAIKRTKKVKQTSLEWANRYLPWEAKISPPPSCIHSQLAEKSIKGVGGGSEKQSELLHLFFLSRNYSPALVTSTGFKAGVKQWPRDPPVPAASKGIVKPHNGGLCTSMPEGEVVFSIRPEAQRMKLQPA